MRGTGTGNGERGTGRRVPLLCLLLAGLSFLSGCPVPNGGEKSWLVMGTTATVKWRDTRDFPQHKAPDRVRASFSLVEKLLNAHDPNSELSRLAPLSDAEILEKCTSDVRPCYAAAFRLRDQSCGVFNPRWKGPGTMDLGAIAKGFAVDKAIGGWIGRDVKGHWRLLVDLGGNLRAAGTKGWTVGIKDGGSFELEPGQACATSGEYFRGKHIRDGRTGVAVTNDVYSVTVVHPSSAMLADGLSTILFILGRAEGDRFLKLHYPEAKAHWTMKSTVP